jgi:hypothetical protein
MGIGFQFGGSLGEASGSVAGIGGMPAFGGGLKYPAIDKGNEDEIGSRKVLNKRVV